MSTMEIDILFDEVEECLTKNGCMVLSRLLKAENAEIIEMSLLITGQDRIRQLNKDYRKIDKPTDVLSFAMQDELPSEDGEDFAFIIPSYGTKQLGEVIISYPQAVIQAEEHRHSVKKEVAVLTIHGVLHLLGYDHMKDDEADIMEAREQAILESLSGGLL